MLLSSFPYAHVLETWPPKTSVLFKLYYCCKQYYCLFWEGVNADESRKCFRGKEASRLSQRTWTDLETDYWTTLHVFCLTTSSEILYLHYHIVLGIFGLKLLVPHYWKPFWDANVLYILSNWNGVDYFGTHSIVRESYFAIIFFPLPLCRFAPFFFFRTNYIKFLTNKSFLFVRKVNVRAYAVLRNSLCNSSCKWPYLCRKNYLSLKEWMSTRAYVKKYKSVNLALNLRIKRIKVLDLYQVLCYLTQSWSLVNRVFCGWFHMFFSEYIIFVIVPVIFQLGWLYPWFLPKFQPNILILESNTFYMFVKKIINESFFFYFLFFLSFSFDPYKSVQNINFWAEMKIFSSWVLCVLAL